MGEGGKWLVGEEIFLGGGRERRGPGGEGAAVGSDCGLARPALASRPRGACGVFPALRQNSWGGPSLRVLRGQGGFGWTPELRTDNESFRILSWPG